MTGYWTYDAVQAEAAYRASALSGRRRPVPAALAHRGRGLWRRLKARRVAR